MPDVIVAGGVYYERCLTPSVVKLLGSGGRAASALSSFCNVRLETFFPLEHRDEVILNMAPFGVEAVVHPSPAVLQFFYIFPLSMPRIAPVPVPIASDARVLGKKVVRFGCIEGEMIVDAEMAVFDPQSGSRPEAFGKNGSRSERLAMILNSGELQKLAGLDADAPYDQMVSALTDRPEVVVVKCGPFGAVVFEHGKYVGNVPAYHADPVYKIGSGDIFTAMFANAWMNDGAAALDAADSASRYVAEYVETQLTRMPKSPPDKKAISISMTQRRVYLAGSFFNTEHIWIIDELHTAIEALGVKCFSPWHDVGVGTGKEVADADLEALKDCHVVLALLSDMDPGTLIEIGYAMAEGIPVFAVVSNNRPQDLTMLSGGDVRIYEDLSTAAYHAAWAEL